MPQLIGVVDFCLELATCKVYDLSDLCLRVEGLHERALLRNFQKLDVQVLFGYAAVAETELQEEVLELHLGWVALAGDSHGEDPEGHGVIEVLGLCQAVVEESDAHLKDDAALWLVG